MHQFLPYRPERDVYRLLQVDPTADAEQITAACRRLARHFHPDRNGSPRANEEMQVVNAIRGLLTDRGLRAAYDGSRRRYLEARAPAGGAAPAPAGRAEPLRAFATGRPAALLASSAASAASAASFGAQRLALTGRALRRALRAALTAAGAGRCPACGDVVDDEDRYCGGCGTRLGRAASGGDPTGDPPAGGRFGVGPADL